MLPFDEALSRLLDTVKPLSAERVPLDEAAGRVLAEEILATSPMPAFDYSAMDGYALASADLTGDGPWDLPVAGESAAGGEAGRLAPTSCFRIFTGASLPEGADCVVMQEQVERRGDVITLRTKARVGDHVRRRGADLEAGALALERGRRLGPGQIALAASLDRPQLYVARRPVVSVLCSGDELCSPGETKRPGMITESNGYFVAAAARAAGAIARIGPFVRDEPEASRAAVAEALRGSDVVVTIGGVSVGDRDVIRPALEAAGVKLSFWRVKMKPGKPLCVGQRGATHVLGLPGNPASASLTFLLFGVPLLRALQGDAAPLPARSFARLASAIRRKPGRQEFVRVRLEMTKDGSLIHALPNQSSGAVTSFAEAEALAIIPADRDHLETGDLLEVIRIADI